MKKTYLFTCIIFTMLIIGLKVNATEANCFETQEDLQFSVKVTDCVRVDKNVWITVTVTNHTNKEYAVNIDLTPNRTKIYGEDGNSYPLSALINGDYKETDDMDDKSIYIKSNNTEEIVLVAHNVPTSIKKFTTLNLGVPRNDFFKGCDVIKDIYITKQITSNQDDNIECSYPFIFVDLVSCSRIGNDLILNLNMTLKTGESCLVSWDFPYLTEADNSAIDNLGNSHEVIFELLPYMNKMSLLELEKPGKGVIKIKKVPSSIKELREIIIFFKTGLSHKNILRIKNLNLAQQLQNNNTNNQFNRNVPIRSPRDLTEYFFNSLIKEDFEAIFDVMINYYQPAYLNGYAKQMSEWSDEEKEKSRADFMKKASESKSRGTWLRSYQIVDVKINDNEAEVIFNGIWVNGQQFKNDYFKFNKIDGRWMFRDNDFLGS